MDRLDARDQVIFFRLPVTSKWHKNLAKSKELWLGRQHLVDPLSRKVQCVIVREIQFGLSKTLLKPLYVSCIQASFKRARPSWLFDPDLDFGHSYYLYQIYQLTR